MSWTQEAIEEAIQSVGKRAAADAEFRELCTNNIHEAIRQESGLEVPASFKIGVLDQSANQLSIILPPVAKEADELLESELESVAGGSKSGATDFFNSIGDPIIYAGGRVEAGFDKLGNKIGRFADNAGL